MAQGSSNPTTDIKKIGGTAVDVSTGNASTGTQRVVLASNQPAIPATQSGTWNIATLTNQTQMNGQAISMGTGVRDAGTQRVTIATNDSVPVTGTFWQATQPVSIAATIAVNQTQVNGSAVVTGGTAGTQAIGGVQAHDAAVSGNNPVLIGGVANTATPVAVASGDVSQLWTTTTGALNVADAGGSLTVDGTVAATQSGTWNIATLTNQTQMNGQAISMGTGVRDAGTQRVTIATNDVVPASQSGTWNIATVTNLSQLGGTAISMNTGVRDAGTQRVTIATNDVVPVSQSGTWNINAVTSITNALPAGTNAIGKLAANDGVDIGDVTINNTQAAGVFSRVTDGTNTAAVKAASTAAAAADPSLVVGLSPNSPLPAGTNGIGKLTTNDGVDIGDVTINNAIGNGVYTRVTDGTNTMPTADVAARSSFHRVTDGTNTAAVKAASTAAAAADPSLVVGLSPNSSLPTGTNNIGTVELASKTTGPNTNATTSAYAASLVIKASAGTLYMLTGYSSRTTAQFIQLHNATSLPANGSVPVVVFRVPETSNFSFDLGAYGRAFSTGIVACVSSTGPTLTVGSADTWFDAQFR